MRTNSIVASDKNSPLDGDNASGTDISAEPDMATYVEVPALDAGRYRLDVILRRSLFMPTKKYPTCIKFDMIAEYVVRNN